MRKRRGNIASQILKILYFVIQTRKHLKHIDFGSFEIPESLKISQTGLFLGFCDILYSWYHKIAKTT